MFFNPTIIQFGSRSFGLIDVIEIAAATLFLLLLIITILAWRAQSGRRAERHEAQSLKAELEYRMAELHGMLGQFSDQTQSNQVHMQRALDERLDAVGHRVGQGLADQSQRTSESLGQLNERLAVIDAAQNNLQTLSQEMLSLKDILANKQTRGGNFSPLRPLKLNKKAAGTISCVF